MEKNYIIADFLRIKNKFLKIYLLARFYNNLIQTSRKCYI